MAEELTPEQMTLLRVGVVLEQIAVYGRLIHRTVLALQRNLAPDSEQRADAAAILYAVDQITTVATIEHNTLQQQADSPADIDPLLIN